MTPTPWRAIVRYALVGALLTAFVVLWDVNRTGSHPANLIQPGASGPAAALMQRDFPDIELTPGLGLDGQQYYAMARSPWHLDDAAQSLDRPIYRWQRPLFPWLARVVHPMSGGGPSLVIAFVIVGLAALFLGGVAAGALSHALGGRTWPALVFALLPGAYMSLRVTMSDALALALVIAALALSAHRRVALAVLVACAAVLARETTVIVLVGWWLGRRTRANALLAAVPIAVAGAWAVWLRLVLSSPRSETVNELGAPFVGFIGAVRHHWLAGHDRLGMSSTLGALALCAFALVSIKRSHALFWPIVCNLAFMSLMNRDVVGIDFGATRSTMPLALLSLLAIATVHRSVDASAPQQGAAGMAPIPVAAIDDADAGALAKR